MSNAPSENNAPPKGTWQDETTIRTSDGKLVPRWGKAAIACKILGVLDKDHLYMLIRTGIIVGYRLSPDKPNSPYIIDLLSVWNHKQDLIKRARG